MIELDGSAILDYMVTALRGATAERTKFYPYHHEAHLAILHDSVHQRLSIQVTMMVKKTPEIWQRIYYVPPGEITEDWLEPLAYDAGAALVSFIKSVETMLAVQEG